MSLNVECQVVAVFHTVGPAVLRLQAVYLKTLAIASLDRCRCCQQSTDDGRWFITLGLQLCIVAYTPPGVMQRVARVPLQPLRRDYACIQRGSGAELPVGPMQRQRVT